jgi:hypothetical protein
MQVCPDTSSNLPYLCAYCPLWQRLPSTTFCFVPARLWYGCGKLRLVTILRQYRVLHPSGVPNVLSLRFSSISAEPGKGSATYSPKGLDRLAAKVLSGSLVLPR